MTPAEIRLNAATAHIVERITSQGTTMTTKYLARHAGQIVGRRTTENRTYSHAYVMQYDEAKAREAACGYVATKQDRKTYDWYAGRVASGVGARAWPDSAYLAHVLLTEKDIAEAREQISGGFEAYVARLRQNQIDRFEHKLAKGGFSPFVGGWASRLDLAEKAARQYAARGCDLVAIVPAEVATPGREGPALLTAILNNR
jgi:hypothetical protein